MNESLTQTPETSPSTYNPESAFLPRLDLPAQPFGGTRLVDLLPTSPLLAAPTVAAPTYSSASVLADTPAYGLSALTAPADITRPTFDGLHDAITDRRTSDRGTDDRRSVVRQLRLAVDG